MAKLEFSEKDKIKCLLWSNRHCCLCGKACGTDIEVAHIDTSKNDIDHAIPLCYDCHAKIGCYNTNHPKGNKYRPHELKKRRNQIYEEYTRHLVPPIHFEITQTLLNGRGQRPFPDIGFTIRHLGSSLPVKVLVVLEIFLGDRLLGKRGGYYGGKKPWNMNPRLTYQGHFSMQDEVVKSTERLKIKVHATVIDQYERHHKLLPVGWVYMRDENAWYADP